MELNVDLKTKDGQTVRAVNCNYEYIFLEAPLGGSLGSVVELTVPHGEDTMHCKAEPSKPGLYRVENWRDLLFDNVYEVLFNLPKREAGDGKAEPEKQ